jgi:hypothetical protein
MLKAFKLYLKLQIVLAKRPAMASLAILGFDDVTHMGLLLFA